MFDKPIQMLAKLLLTVVYLFISIKACNGHIQEGRALPLFFTANGGVLNFVCGFGIPVQDLDYETVLTGIVFKSQHFLPAKPKDLRILKTVNVNGRNFDKVMGTQLPSNNVTDLIKMKQTDLSTYRWFLYKALEQLSARLTKYPARPCILRSICEAAAVPFVANEHILSEILHIFLTPSLSEDALTSHKDNEYIAAEYLGREGASCATIFHECSKSFLDDFSKIFHHT